MDEKSPTNAVKPKETFLESIGPDYRAYYSNRVAVTIITSEANLKFLQMVQQTLGPNQETQTLMDARCMVTMNLNNFYALYTVMARIIKNNPGLFPPPQQSAAKPKNDDNS